MTHTWRKLGEHICVVDRMDVDRSVRSHSHPDHNSYGHCVGDLQSHIIIGNILYFSLFFMWSNLRRPLSPNRMTILLSTVAKLIYYIYHKSRSPSGGGVQTETYHAAGSYSAHTRINSSRWWGPKMEESRVRYSKLSIMTATNRFNIWRKWWEKRIWRSWSRKNYLWEWY